MLLLGVYYEKIGEYPQVFANELEHTFYVYWAKP